MTLFFIFHIYEYINLQNMEKQLYAKNENPESDWGIVRTNHFSVSESADKRFFVVDNFYNDPEAVRNFALQQYYYDDPGYLGMRTRKQFFFDGVKEKFEQIIGQPITQWENQGMNGRFQSCVAGTPLVYHCDEQHWAGMVYLTPNAPFEGGTSFYAHKQTRIRHNSQDGIMNCFVLRKSRPTQICKTLYAILGRHRKGNETDRHKNKILTLKP